MDMKKTVPAGRMPERNNGEKKEPRVAYFCMEYGLGDELRLYAGGLGILAGDTLKAARDLGKPVIGIGILWRQGYTKQLIGENGRPFDSYPLNDYLYDLVDDTGVTVSLKIKDNDIRCRVWKLENYGNAPLYLLDTNMAENSSYKWITGQLYGWFSEERIAQEMVLGIGGVRALRELGIEVDIYHFNEGHAVFAGLELIREKKSAGLDFKQALEKTREEIVFTTHTPVKEGNESHKLDTIKYMGGDNGLSLEEMIEIGGNPFNMTVAGLKLSRVTNAVSRLHGETAREMWKDVEGGSRIKAVTNGVHQETWLDERIINAFREGTDLWQVHQKLKEELIDFVRSRTGVELNQDSLLIGFARRAALYKRSDLIFRRPEIIDEYLREGRIQIIFSGKAHPLDDPGKETVAKLVSMTRKYPRSVVFLEDYDMEIARKMTRGADIWLNNPRRPKEASGTSGMKAALNGVLNLSTLDGWWPEACNDGVNGWQFGSGYEGEAQDEHDLQALYDVLLNKVLPLYEENREKWVEMMKASIGSVYEQFSAAAMLEKYYQEIYNN